MNRANRVIGGLKAFKGGISATVVDHRIIFATALKVLSSGIVIAHNHPSGNLEASEEDLKLTKKIKEAGELLDIRLIDHLILGIKDDYSSFMEKGWI
jgi:DNA repair protein RadC